MPSVEEYKQIHDTLEPMQQLALPDGALPDTVYMILCDSTKEVWGRKDGVDQWTRWEEMQFLLYEKKSGAKNALKASRRLRSEAKIEKFKR